MDSIHLMGGGWNPAGSPALYGPFLDSAGPTPTVATLVVDEGDGPARFQRWADVLRRTAPCAPVPVLVPIGTRFDVAALGDADALLVCGGRTPAYAEALVPAAASIRSWLIAGGRPYGGFSAGAAVAAAGAVVGGWRRHGVPICPEESGEDLDEVTIRDGLGLVPWTVDVHCAAWGTLPRLLTALSAAGAPRGLALDEDTAVHLADGEARVAGLGSVWVADARGGRTATISDRRSGDLLDRP